MHNDFAACLAAAQALRWFAVSTRGTTRCDTVAYRRGDLFVFGPETRGLPSAVLDECAPDRRIRLPMRPEVRSLNLANAVAVVVYEAWRQAGFAGAVTPART